MHVSFKETNLLDPRKYDNKLGILPDALKMTNLVNSNQERGGFQSPLEQKLTNAFMICQWLGDLSKISKQVNYL